MPQFDSFSFFSQIFWVVLFSSFFYLFILKYYLRNIGENFKITKKILAFKLKVFKKSAVYNKIFSKFGI